LPDDAGPDELRTRTGMLMGTPQYMSPEQCRESASVTDRSDVYSLGIILYEALGGKPPFTGQPLSVMMRHIDTVPPPLRQLDQDTPEEIAQPVHAMLAKEPEARPAMAAVEERLRELGGARTLPPADRAPPAPAVTAGPTLGGRKGAALGRGLLIGLV